MVMYLLGSQLAMIALALAVSRQVQEHAAVYIVAVAHIVAERLVAEQGNVEPAEQVQHILIAHNFGHLHNQGCCHSVSRRDRMHKLLKSCLQQQKLRRMQF